MRIKGGPVVLAESSDSTGSGSPGDSTGVLKHLVRAPLAEPAAIFLVDPAAVAAAIEGRDRLDGDLEDWRSVRSETFETRESNGNVKLISDGRWTARARGYNTGITTCMGRAVVLEVGQVQILMAERSSMTVDPELFRSHGIDPVHCKIVVVKSPNGFRAAYEPIAKAIFLVDTPGVSTANLRKLPWRRIPRPIYPLDRETPKPADSATPAWLDPSFPRKRGSGRLLRSSNGWIPARASLGRNDERKSGRIVGSLLVSV